MKDVSAGRHQMRPIRADTRAVSDWLKQTSRRYLILCVRLHTGEMLEESWPLFSNRVAVAANFLTFPDPGKFRLRLHSSYSYFKFKTCYVYLKTASANCYRYRYL